MMEYEDESLHTIPVGPVLDRSQTIRYLLDTPQSRYGRRGMEGRQRERPIEVHLE